jgi:hypothetical protein
MSDAEEDWKAMLKRGQPLPLWLVLSTDLLKEIGVGPSRVEAVSKSLFEKGRETLGNLLDIKDEYAAKEAAGDEVSGERLWSFVQKQNKAQDAVAAASVGDTL